MNRRLLACFSILLLLAMAISPFAVQATSAPEAPELTVTQHAGYFTLSWNSPKSASAITGYVYSYGLVSEGDSGKVVNNTDKMQRSADTPALDAYGDLYEFTVFAVSEAGNGAVSTPVTSKLLHQNDINVEKAKDALEKNEFIATINEAGTREALSSWLKEQIEALRYNVAVTVNVSSFEAAELAKTGSFIFTAELSMGNSWEPNYASTITQPLRGTISSSGKLSAPKIVISTSEDGGLGYVISTTGTASQAEMIERYKVTVYDALSGEVVVSDYSVNAAERSGVLNLGIGLKGESSYRAAVKASSNNTLKYLDSDLSESSVAVKAGRIPITVKPDVTEKLYGDTEPIFGYTIENGPNPLPTGVNLKLTFSRAPGEEIGTYELSWRQDDTNYAVTVLDSTFEIKKRPLVITPKTREVIYEKGVTFLLNEVGESDGLVAGDEITSLSFDSKDARGEVGEYEIRASKAIVMSGTKDVTKNYEITFAAGKLIVHPVGYSAQGSSAFQLWILFVILAVLLLCAGGVVFFLLWRKNQKKKKPNNPASPTPSPEEEPEETEAFLAPPQEKPQTEAPTRDVYKEYLEIVDMNALEEQAENELREEQLSQNTREIPSLPLGETAAEEAVLEEASEKEDPAVSDETADAEPEEPAIPPFHSHPIEEDPLEPDESENADEPMGEDSAPIPSEDDSEE